MQVIKVAVIGGGPGGLATLKTLLAASTPEQPIEAHLFESERDIGGTFKYRSYENAELVSSRQLTAFSDFRFPPGPDHISLPDYVEYLHAYVQRFNLRPHISLGCRVVNIAPTELPGDPGCAFVSGHRIVYQRDVQGRASTTDVFECTHLAICTGLHVQPEIPKIDGLEHYQGISMHSSSYKARSQLQGHDVLVLGCGETAMDLAYEAIKAPAKSVTLAYRTGWLSFPKVLNRFRVFGKTFGGSLPIDGLITNLFETAYVHHTVHATRLRSRISDIVIKKVMYFLTGTQEGCNQHIGALPNELLGRSYVFLNKSAKAMPYLNRPYKRDQPLLQLIGNEYMDLPEDANSERSIDTCTWPSHFEPDGQVVFQQDKTRKDWNRLSKEILRPSLLVYCTGYRQDFAWLNEAYPTPNNANVRNIVKSDVPEVAFIGFVRPGVGAIPPIAEQQAMWWTALITRNMTMPQKAGHYRLLARPGSRIEYGVDYSSYMAVLARDFGGAPSLIGLWRECGLRMLFIYCFGASFVSFYRLTGPFATPIAKDVAETELLDTILRRGVVGNLFFGLIPMVFYGVVNILAYVLERLGMVSPAKPTVGVDMSEG